MVAWIGFVLYVQIILCVTPEHDIGYIFLHHQIHWDKIIRSHYLMNQFTILENKEQIVKGRIWYWWQNKFSHSSTCVAHTKNILWHYNVRVPYSKDTIKLHLMWLKKKFFFIGYIINNCFLFCAKTLFTFVSKKYITLKDGVFNTSC